MIVSFFAENILFGKRNKKTKSCLLHSNGKLNILTVLYFEYKDIWVQYQILGQSVSESRNRYRVDIKDFHISLVATKFTIPIRSQSIYTLLVRLSVCLSVCIHNNVKTADPIGPKFCVGPQMTPGKVFGCSKLQKIVYISF